MENNNVKYVDMRTKELAPNVIDMRKKEPAPNVVDMRKNKNNINVQDMRRFKFKSSRIRRLFKKSHIQIKNFII